METHRVRGRIKNKKGFTLVELMVVIAIVGIMSATAIPLYRTYQQRAYGSQATLMMKQILDGQILYFLDKNKFFPEESGTIEIYENDSPNKDEILDLAAAINVTIPVGNHLNYNITTENIDGAERCVVVISADFPLYKDGSKQLIGEVKRDGQVYTFAGG